MVLTNLSTNISTYIITVTAVDATGAPLTGASAFSNSTGVSSSLATHLETLPTIGTQLTTVTGYYTILVNGFDICGNQFNLTAYAHVVAPTPMIDFSMANSTPNPTTIDATATSLSSFYEVYNCPGVNLTLTPASSYITSYSIEVRSITSSGVLLSGGSYLGDVSTLYSTICPTNLFSLPAPIGTWLDNPANAGYYEIIVNAETICGTFIAETSYVHLNTPPSPVTVNLQINNAISGTPCWSETASSMCPTGTYTLTYNIGTSTFGANFITSYSRQIDEVDCSSGAVISNVYTDGTLIPVSSSTTGCIGLGLNSISIGGSTGYFLTKLGHCYKLTVTGYNACGSASDWSYFDVNGAYKTAPSSVISVAGNSDQVTLQSNPIHNIAQFNLHLVVDRTVSLFVYNVQGQVVNNAYNFKNIKSGEQTLSIDLSEVPSGFYTYKILCDGIPFIGKIVKD
jgi:hypothetical protein